MMSKRSMYTRPKTKTLRHDSQNVIATLSNRLAIFEKEILTIVPDFKVSERHAFLMARKVMACLRKAQGECQQRHEKLLQEAFSRNLGRKGFEHVRRTMLSNLGAVQLDASDRKHNVVHYIEVGDDGDDTIYLCTAVCDRRNPIESWGWSKRIAVSKHALERAFLRGCIWAKGTVITLAQIAKELFGVYWSYFTYQQEYSSQSSGLLKRGWNMNLSDESTQYIVRFDSQDVPVVMTVFKANSETPEGGLVKMIPPQGSYENPKLVANLSQLGLQNMARSA
jgi:hypothetical protein